MIKQILFIITMGLLLGQNPGQKEWITLFDGKTVSGMRGYKMDSFPWNAWTIEDSSLKTIPGGKGVDIISTETYKDFELELEWKLQPGGNSGIFYFATEENHYIWQSAPEMQILDNTAHHDRLRLVTSAGALYDLIAPSEDVVNPIGDFNQVKIISRDNHIEHCLNGKKILEYDYDSLEFKNLIFNSKFKDMPHFAKASSGHIGLQGDHGEVWYRNIRIRKL
jgi:cytochrome c